MTDDHRLGDLTNIYFSQFWRLEHQRSRCIVSLESSLPSIDSLLFAISSEGRSKRAPWGSLYKGPDLIHEGFPS